MRRIIMVLLVVLLIAPFAPVSAQEDKVLWELTEDFTVTDLGFQFKYPEGWVYGAKNGIGLAETDEDLEALMDDDSSTSPEGYTISLIAFDPADLQVEEDTTLSDILDTLIKTYEIETTSSSPLELGVMTRRSLTVLGTNKNKRSGILTVWQQPGYVVLFSLGMSDFSDQANYTWGQILGSVQPTNALATGKSTIPLPDRVLKVPIPDGWSKDLFTRSTVVAFEPKDDSKSKGYYMYFSEYAPEVLKEFLKIDDFPETVEDVIKLFPTLKESDSIITTEHIVLGKRALMLRGEDKQKDGYWSLVIYFIYNNRAYFFRVIAPSEETLNEFEPTWLLMLDTIQSVEK